MIPAVLKPTEAAELDSVLRQKIRVTAIHTVTAMPGVCGVGKVAEVAPEENIAIQIAAQVSNSGIPKISGIDALRKQGKGVEEIEVLRVVIEAECGFDFTAA